MTGMCSNATLNNILFRGYSIFVHDQGLTMKHVDLDPT
jgi:hypothetical protein